MVFCFLFNVFMCNKNDTLHSKLVLKSLKEVSNISDTTFIDFIITSNSIIYKIKSRITLHSGRWFWWTNFSRFDCKIVVSDEDLIWSGMFWHHRWTEEYLLNYQKRKVNHLSIIWNKGPRCGPWGTPELNYYSLIDNIYFIFSDVGNRHRFSF